MPGSKVILIKYGMSSWPVHNHDKQRGTCDHKLYYQTVRYAHPNRYPRIALHSLTDNTYNVFQGNGVLISAVSATCSSKYPFGRVANHADDAIAIRTHSFLLLSSALIMSGRDSMDSLNAGSPCRWTDIHLLAAEPFILGLLTEAVKALDIIARMREVLAGPGPKP